MEQIKEQSKNQQIEKIFMQEWLNVLSLFNNFFQEDIY